MLWSHDTIHMNWTTHTTHYCKSKNRNPCDFFMKELSINYPKTEADEAKIRYYVEKYERE